MWDAAEPVFAQSQGSYQPLSANGHVLQGHGSIPKIEEYDESGTIVMRARFGFDNTMQSYRAYRYPWIGRQSTKPDVVACPFDTDDDEKSVAVYVVGNERRMSSRGEYTRDLKSRRLQCAMVLR